MARSPKKSVVEYAGRNIAGGIASRGFGSRGQVIAACALLCAGIVFAYAGAAWASVLYRLLSDGVLLAFWLVSAAGLGAAVLLPFALEAEGKNSAVAETDASERFASPRCEAEVAATPASPLAEMQSWKRRRWRRGYEGMLYLVTAAALGLGVFSLVTLGLGLAGWLNRFTAFGLLGVGVAFGLAVLVRSRRHSSAPFVESVGVWLRAPAGWAWLWLAAMPFLAIAVVAALCPPGTMWPGEPHGYDVVEYHLQIPREWYELGRIVPLHHNAFSFFPFNVEMHYLLAMHLQGGPWAGMYLAHFMHLSMIVLTVVAVYGFAGGASASPAAATIAALAAAAVPWLTQLGSIAYNEGGLLLFGTLAMGWAFDAAISPSRRLGRFPVAGLTAGFACGCKLTGVPEVLLAVGGVSFLAILFTQKQRVAASLPLPPGFRAAGTLQGWGEGDVSGESRISTVTRPHPNPLPEGEGTRSRLVQERALSSDETVRRDPADDGPAVPLFLRLAGLATFFLAALLAFCPWLIRNQFWAGNPVFPEAASVLGQGHFSDAQVDRWKQAHAPRPDQRSLPARLAAWRSDVWLGWQYGYLLLPLGLVAGIVAASNRHRINSRHPDLLKNIRMAAFSSIAMFVGLSVVWLGFTHLQGRFFILGVPIAALLVGHIPWGRLAPIGAVIVLLAAVPGWSRLHSVLAERLYENKLSLLLGFEQLSDVFVPQAFTDPLASAAPVVLVGDAKAFVYPGPMSRLSYRTVFDVDAQPGESSIDAWARGGPPNAWLLVDPVELRRFHDTYRSIPPLPVEYAGRTEPFVIPPRQRQP